MIEKRLSFVFLPVVALLVGAASETPPPRAEMTRPVQDRLSVQTAALVAAFMRRTSTATPGCWTPAPWPCWTPI